MNTFRKVLGEWCVVSLTGQTGQTVTVTKRNGQTSQVVLGAQVAPGCFKLGQAARPAAAAAETVGDLSRIVARFDRARQHLRMPAIALDGFRVNIAGDRAREPGSLTITSVDRGYDGRRAWLGRVTLAGTFEPGRGAPADLGARLRAFAADPAGVAAEFGRLHGKCCFCRRALTDERSTAVGYGPDCAENFGLVWGSRVPAPTLPRSAPVAPLDLGTARGTALSRARAATRTYLAEQAAAVQAGQPIEDEPFECDGTQDTPRYANDGRY